MTQSLFKNKGASGFRRLQMGKMYFSPISISDFVECTVFEGAVNRTATITVEKTVKSFSFPLPYYGYFPKGNAELPESASLDHINQLTDRIAMDAFPSASPHRDSPWVTCPKAVSSSMKTILGQSCFRAYEGVNSGGLVGAYWVTKTKRVDAKHTLIENLGNAGKIKVPIITHKVEEALLYPYIRGRDVKRWLANPSCLYLLTHDPQSRRCIPEATMRRQYPNVYAYLLNFKNKLLTRKTAPIKQQMQEGPFYPVLGIGPHSVADWRIVFKDLTELFQCCVVGPNDSSIENKPVLADYTLRIIPANNEQEAHCIAALLNSTPCVAALYYSSAGVQTQRYHAGDAEKINIKLYTGDRIERELARLSHQCHVAAKEGKLETIVEIEKEIDSKAAEYWGIDRAALRAIQKAIAPIGQSSRLYEGIVAESGETDNG